VSVGGWDCVWGWSVACGGAGAYGYGLEEELSGAVDGWFGEVGRVGVIVGDLEGL